MTSCVFYNYIICKVWCQHNGRAIIRLLPSVAGRWWRCLRTGTVYKYCILADYVNFTPGNYNIFALTPEAHHPTFAVNYNGNKSTVFDIDFDVVHISESCSVGFADNLLVPELSNTATHTKNTLSICLLFTVVLLL